MKTLYTAQVTAQGGRDGHVKSSDGHIDFKVSTPKEMGGAGGATNPEQLFAAGYAACFENALLFVGRKEKMSVGHTAVTATVGIGANNTGGFALNVKLDISLPGLTADQARHLVDIAHTVCPYSNATRGNIPVELNIVQTA